MWPSEFALGGMVGRASLTFLRWREFFPRKRMAERASGEFRHHRDYCRPIMAGGEGRACHGAITCLRRSVGTYGRSSGVRTWRYDAAAAAEQLPLGVRTAPSRPLKVFVPQWLCQPTVWREATLKQN